MDESDESDETRRDRMWGKGGWMICERCPRYPEFPWVVHSRTFHETRRTEIAT